MKFTNETYHTIVVPVRLQQLAPEHIKVKPGETKDFPESSAEQAGIAGLTLVKETEVKAEVSSVGDTPVETKQIDPDMPADSDESNEAIAESTSEE